MRHVILLAPLVLALSCAQTTQCRIDNDCQELEYCYKVALDPESADGTEPGFPYEEFGTCASDCTSDADCYGSARCTPKGICKDLSLSADRQWGGYEPGLEGVLAASAYAPMLTCSGFMDCMLACESDRATCNDCLQQVDPPSLQPANDLWNCLLTECDGASFAVCMNGPCENQKVMCRNDG
ncbi:MAG: hypothetical protein VYB65_13295 [Myxococcota bacterium]|nr:hypothetical protein [Myxococcota bacterium]